MMSRLSERVKSAMTAAGISQVALARACNISQPSVASWLNGTTKTLKAETAVAAAKALNVNVRWLVDGTGSPEITVASKSNIEPAEIGTRRIPLIEFKFIAQPIDPQLYPYLLTDMETSDKAYAVAIKDSSMLPKFEIGDRVIVDPEVRPVPGDFVIVRVDSNEPIFRKIRELGTDINGNIQYEFVPLNDDFSVIRSDRHSIEILGTMLEYRKYRKP
ncbi:S24 family peptidase [uncultured Parasutterella sp.]|uniref:S24 family peptidase n=1 Tax=uncultured Parasutterella sp. TaxID=1263098 RepID=UPI0025B6866F|nr:S24 family peptidase [uncultured Parasutterella sp.]